MPTPQPYPHQLEPGTKGGVLGTGLRGMVWVFSRWKLCQVPAVLGGCEGHGLPTSMSVTLHFFPPSPLLRPEDLGGLLSCPPGCGRPCLDPGTLRVGPQPHQDLLRAVEGQRCPVRLHGGCDHRVKQRFLQQLLVTWGKVQKPPAYSPTIMWAQLPPPTQEP